jgi:hypothetical protein
MQYAERRCKEQICHGDCRLLAHRGLHTTPPVALAADRPPERGTAGQQSPATPNGQEMRSY